MVVGILRIELHVFAGSLKEKRAVVKSLTARVQSRFNAAVAEVDTLDAHETATIAVVCVSNEAPHADAMLQKIARFVETQRLDATVESITTEIIHV